MSLTKLAEKYNKFPEAAKKEVEDFVEFVENKYFENKTIKNEIVEVHDFFSSAGLWKNRDVTAIEIREKAWKRGN